MLTGGISANVMVKDSARGGRLVLFLPSVALGRGEGVWGRLRKTHYCKTLVHPKVSITTLMLHWDPWEERKGERRGGGGEKERVLLQSHFAKWL